MLNIKEFTFNPFQENTYILYDSSKECAIVDPGCSNKDEEQKLVDFIESNGLKPVKLLNTHCHIDHILGNHFINTQYNLMPEYHSKETPILEGAKQMSQLYGIAYKESPLAKTFIEEGDKIKFGNTELSILFVPGHSPGHIVFINEEQKVIMGGDVLFYGSIGRTDLPFGDHETLIEMIKKKLFTLNDNYTVYSGHGPKTQLDFEKKHNPFLT